MPQPTAFHARTHALCTSLAFKEWAGCHAVRRYDTYVDREYYALRHQATVMDATPLYKYEIRGQGARALLSRISVRDFTRHAVGRVSYVCWTDHAGKVLDDGTVSVLADDHLRLTSAEPTYAWLTDHARDLDVRIDDVSRSLAALAVQGPRARDVLRPVVGGGIDALRFFRAMPARFGLDGGSAEGVVTRTGYTGDLGYELWVENDRAIALLDAVLEAGRPHGLLPMGLDALDVSRVEAGFVLNGVDYTPARHAFIERQKSTPAELGFDWMLQLEREPFVGQQALLRERQAGRRRAFVGLVVDWDAFEEIHDRFGLVPHLATETCREGVPLLHGGAQIGYATSRAWSPLLKQYLALGTIDAAHAAPGTTISIEVTCEYERHTAAAVVTPLPFFDPERKKA